MIGVYASPLNRIEPDRLKYSVSVLERAIRINYSKRSHAKFKNCFLMVNPLELVDFGLLDVGKMDRIYQIGYESANRAIHMLDNLEQIQNKVRK